MPIFEVKTNSTFEHVYYVEAETEALAVESVLDSYGVDYAQKHMGERAIEAKELSEDTTYAMWLKDARERNYL
jgi:hypothetical protein